MIKNDIMWAGIVLLGLGSSCSRDSNDVCKTVACVSPKDARDILAEEVGKDVHEKDVIEFDTSSSDTARSADIPENMDMRRDTDLSDTSTFCNGVQVVLEATDPNAVEHYDNDYRPFSSKEDLHPQTLARTCKRVFIINQGGGDTSVPSCVNGKKVLNNCAPTGWRLGFKADEIYALRLITADDYTSGLFKTEQNTFSGGQTIQANYKYVLSEKPGDMGPSPFEGHCETRDANSSTYLLLSPTKSSSSFCKIPRGTLIYINMELLPEDTKKCATALCNNYFTLSGFKLPSGLNR